ncbi:hypothetical protein BWI93_06710 [Siphonobacter sp. BAB-5385]|uniref:AsmA family protein n=1 Tax=unclassified Siphonobacter TaxID=2635712 RepID=UPI000B9EBCCA|nr:MULTISPECIES: AsmA family protein [unclassified Siphonobacter]OZI08917.1 hypothetical protein BWI93_06710 [Siphonobacter sp. BAB-5385]PMD96640.1 hypothetical protein BWI97_10715 [Siphonobacter sp. BAB-5405]
MNFHHFRRLSLRLLILCLLLGVGLMAVIYAYRDRLFRQINQQISNQIRGNFQADNFRVIFWEEATPGLTIILQNVRLEDDRHDQHHTDFLNVREVRVRLSLIDLFRRQVQIKHIRVIDGSVTAFRDETGYANWSLFESDSLTRSIRKKKNPNGFLVDIKKVRLENVQVHFSDSLRHKWYGGLFRDVECQISRDGNRIKARIRGPLHLDGLAFNSSRGSFGTNQETDLKLNVQLDTARKLLTLQPSRLVFEKKDTLHAHGHFQFHTRRPPDLNLFLRVQGLAFSKTLDLMPRKLAVALGKFKYYPDIKKANIRISGSTAPGSEPHLDIRFASGPARMESVLGLLTNLRVEGYFTNHLDPKLAAGDANSRILFSHYSADWDDALPVSGRMVLHNLQHTRAFLTTTVDTDLSTLNETLNATSYTLNGGKLRLNAQYRGRVVNVFDPKTGELAGLLRGNLIVEDGQFRYLTRHLNFDQLNVHAVFNERDLVVKQIQTRLNTSPITIRGTIKKLIPFLTSPNTRLYAKAEISSPNLNFNATQFMPRSRKSSPRLREKARRDLIAKVDRVIDQLETDVTVRFDKFQYRHFKASQVKGEMLITQRKLQIRNLAMNAFQGNFNFSGQVDYLRSNPSRVNVSYVLKNTNVPELFRAFDDFQQTTITHQNLRGLLNSEGKISVRLRPDYTLIPGTFDGYLNFNLRNGELIDFKPIKGIQRFIFRNRNFDHIRFATLSNQFRFKGREIEMDKMGIESTALTLFVGGTYSFGNQTDLYVQIPLANLRKRDKDYELARLNTKEAQGWTLNLRAKDEGNETKIRLDLGQKVRQRKAKRQQLGNETVDLR